MAQTIDLGKVMLTNGGVWASGTTYQRLTFVVHEHDGWYSIVDTATEPTDTNPDWQRITNVGQVTTEALEAIAGCQLTSQQMQQQMVAIRAEITSLESDVDLRVNAAMQDISESIATANDAASNANTKAQIANVEATNARTQADYAKDMGDFAESRAEHAEDAATAANTAASAANTAAQNASQLSGQVSDLALEINQTHRKVSENGFFLVDDDDRIAAQYTSEGFDVAKLSSHLKNLIKAIDGIGLVIGEVEGTAYDGAKGKNAADAIADIKNILASVSEHGFYITDASDLVALKYDENGLDAAKVSDHFKTLVGGGSGSGLSATAKTLLIEILQSGVYVNAESNAKITQLLTELNNN